jgi:hypothetical protein
MKTPSSPARDYRRLGYLALAHAVVLLALSPFCLASRATDEPGFWLLPLWVGLVLLWFFWPVVLTLHHGRSALRFTVFISVAAVLLLPTLAFCNTVTPGLFGFPAGVDLNPINDWRYFSAYRAGRLEAQKDVAAGILAIERYGLGAGSDAKILRERFQIEVRAIAGCVVDEKILGHAAGYNEVSEAEIDRRVGLNRVAEASEEAAELAKEEYARQEQSFKELTARLTSLPPDGKIITKFIRPYVDQEPLTDLQGSDELAPLVHAIEKYLAAQVPKDAPPFTLRLSVQATPTSDPTFGISAQGPPGPVYENIHNNLQTFAAPRWTRGSLTVSLDFVIR